MWRRAPLWRGKIILPFEIIMAPLQMIDVTCECEGRMREVMNCAMPYFVIIAVVVINSLSAFDAHTVRRLLSGREDDPYTGPIHEFINRCNPTTKPTIQ